MSKRKWYGGNLGKGGNMFICRYLRYVLLSSFLTYLDPGNLRSDKERWELIIRHPQLHLRRT